MSEDNSKKPNPSREVEGVDEGKRSREREWEDRRRRVRLIYAPSVSRNGKVKGCREREQRDEGTEGGRVTGEERCLCLGRVDQV